MNDEPTTPGMLNGRCPDGQDFARAPHLAALAALYAATPYIVVALRAAHPVPNDARPPSVHTDRLVAAADDVIHHIYGLQASMRRYGNLLGIARLW